jgi:hypothetical protein
MEQFAIYRDSLKELCGPGVVLADLTSVWGTLLKKKSFYDLTGNGLNHPNDFGHLVYAQAILSQLVPVVVRESRTNILQRSRDRFRVPDSPYLHQTLHGMPR